MLYRLLTHTVCEQATMGVFNWNDPFCIVSTRVPQLTSSTIAESNISKATRTLSRHNMNRQGLPRSVSRA